MAEKAADFVDSPHTFIFERNPYTHSTIVMSKHKTFKHANGIFQLLNFFSITSKCFSYRVFNLKVDFFNHGLEGSIFDQNS